MPVKQDQNTRGRLGEILLGSGMVTEDQLASALELAAAKNKRLGEALVELGTLDSDTLTWALGIQFDLSFVEVSDAMIDWQFVRQFPIDELRDLQLLPLSYSEGHVRAVVTDPTPGERAQRIRKLFRDTPVVLHLAAREDILEALDAAEGLSSGSFSELTERDRTTSQLERWIAALASGELDRLLIRPGTDESTSLVVSLSPALTEYAASLSAADLQTYTDRLGEYFTPNIHLAGGFCGLRPRRGGMRNRAIRAISLTGIQGRLLAFQSVPTDASVRPNPQLVVLAGQSQHLIKAALFHACSEFVRDAGRGEFGLLLSLEAHVDSASSAFFQAEIPDPIQRVVLTPHILNACSPRLAVLEVEPGEASNSAALYAQSARLAPLFLVLHAPDEETARRIYPSANELIFLEDNLASAVETLWPFVRERFAAH